MWRYLDFPGDMMKKFLTTIIVLAVLVGGGTWAGAEFYLLPKQEKVWRELLADLPEPIKADFDDLDFSLIGMRLTATNFTLSDGAGSTIKVDEVIAENSPKTAIDNLIRQILGQEEEAYDVVRFVDVSPVAPQSGVAVSIDEIRVHNVHLGIDRDLPPMVQQLTGKIGLTEALQAASADGLEVLGLTASGMGGAASVGALRILELSETNLGLFEIDDVTVSQQGQEMGSLDLLRAVNLNLSTMVDSEAFIAELAKGAEADLERFNMFHSADEIRLEGLNAGLPGVFTVGVASSLYQEAESRYVPGVGTVATKTLSSAKDNVFSFAGLGGLSPEFAEFMALTGIETLTINGDSAADWDLDAKTMASSMGVDFRALMGIKMEVALGNISPEAMIEAMAMPMQMVMGLEDDLKKDAEEGNLEESLDGPFALMNAFAGTDDLITSIYGYMEIQGVILSFEDQSLTGRLLKYFAAQAGLTSEELLAGINENFNMIAASPDFPASLADDLAAVQSFLNEPGTLTLSLTPAEPVRFSEVMELEDPEEITETLGFKITAE